MAFTIAKAVSADLPAVGELYGAVCDGLLGKPYNPGWYRDGFPSLSNARIYLETGTLLLGWEDGVLAGSVGFTDDPSGEDDEGGAFRDVEKEEGYWYIHVLAVHPDYLRRGIGSQLLGAAEEEARQAGVRALRLYVWENNTPAIHAYEKAGYTRIRQGVDIGLSQYGLERFSLYEKSVS